MSFLKRKKISIEDKIEIIKSLESGLKKSIVCQEKGLPYSTVSTIWKKKVAILNAFKNCGHNESD